MVYKDLLTSLITAFLKIMRILHRFWVDFQDFHEGSYQRLVEVFANPYS